MLVSTLARGAALAALLVPSEIVGGKVWKRREGVSRLIATGQLAGGR
jgi:hypothetical protein